MAGLILLMEFMDWTKEEALDAYSFHTNVQYALNLDPVAHDISKRTLERYIKLFEENNLAKTTMEKITIALVGALDIKIDQQRLDSTHIFSDMASFGRTRLMGVATKRFLTQLRRYDVNVYEGLDELFRQRYLPGVNQLFADTLTPAMTMFHWPRTMASNLSGRCPPVQAKPKRTNTNS